MCVRAGVCTWCCVGGGGGALDGVRMEDIMVEGKIKTVPYAFPVPVRPSLWFGGRRTHWEVHFFIVIFVAAALFFSSFLLRGAFRGSSSLIPTSATARDVLTNAAATKSRNPGAAHTWGVFPVWPLCERRCAAWDDGELLEGTQLWPFLG